MLTLLNRMPFPFPVYDFFLIPSVTELLVLVRRCGTSMKPNGTFFVPRLICVNHMATAAGNVTVCNNGRVWCDIPF